MEKIMPNLDKKIDLLFIKNDKDGKRKRNYQIDQAYSYET